VRTAVCAVTTAAGTIGRGGRQRGKSTRPPSAGWSGVSRRSIRTAASSRRPGPGGLIRGTLGTAPIRHAGREPHRGRHREQAGYHNTVTPSRAFVACEVAAMIPGWPVSR
jgi:hypothetical protein